MKRLTAWDKGNAYYPKCFEPPCDGMGCENEHCEFRYDKCKRLAEYEDTGLTPDGINRLNIFDGSQAVKATAKLQEEQRKRRWIPVSERLPTMEEYDRSAAKFIVSDGNKAYEDLFDIYDQCWLDSPNGAVIAIYIPLWFYCNDDFSRC